MKHSRRDAEGAALRVRALRKSLNLSQARFAELVGVDQSNVSRWENGAMPEDARIVKLAGLGGVLGAELMPLEPYYALKYLVLVLVVSGPPIVLALVMYPLAYERCLKNVIASEGRRTGALQRGWATFAAKLLRPLLRTPLQRGLASFMLATLGRSHTHRFLIGIYAGIAFLLALPIAGRLFLEPTTEWRRYAWFAVPLGVVFWLVCFLLGTAVGLVEQISLNPRRLLQITAAGELVTFAPDYPRSVVSADVPGLNPGFVVVVAGYCASGASERVVRVLERVLPETYERIVQVDPSEAASCPTVR